MISRSKRSSPELRRARPLLGTIVSVRVAGADSRDLQRGVDAAFRAMARVQALMSAHDAVSELSRVNRLAHRRAIRVSAQTWAVLRAARRFFLASDGVFDPTVAPHLVRWGYLPDVTGTIPPRTGTMADVDLGPGRRVRFTRPLVLDLGGIAKGYAVDLAVGALRRAGVPRGIVNAGGDLRVFGSAPETVHVRHPRVPRLSLPLAQVKNAAVASSAIYFSRRRVRGRLVTPIVHPSSGMPCRLTSTASVIAPTCMVADALTKIVLLAGMASFPLLARFSASAAIITAEGRIFSSESPVRAA